MSSSVSRGHFFKKTGSCNFQNTVYTGNNESKESVEKYCNNTSLKDFSGIIAGHAKVKGGSE